MKSVLKISIILALTYLGQPFLRAQEIERNMVLSSSPKSERKKGFSQSPKNNPVKNVNFYTDEVGMIHVTYDLQGNPKKKYCVSLYLKKQVDPKLMHKITFARGDIGLDNTTGEKKEILFPKFVIERKIPPDEGDFSFVVSAKEHKREKSILRKTKDPVQNVSFRIEKGIVHVTYDLKGSYRNEYCISVHLKRKTDPAFSYEIPIAEGNIGAGNFAGEKREIVFSLPSLGSEAPADDIYFVVLASEHESEGSFFGLSDIEDLYLISALVGAGGATYYTAYVSKDKNKRSKITPIPPDRP